MSEIQSIVDGLVVALTSFFISIIIIQPLKTAFHEVFCGFGTEMCAYSLLLLFVIPAIGTIIGIGYLALRVLPTIIDFFNGASGSGGGVF